jgi:parallel beta-helix repeat protein/predicted outer membrane repeat protein
MRIAITLLFIFGIFISGFSSIASSAVIHVPDDYATIQEAIDAAMNEDRIVVRFGYYRENIDLLGKSLTLISEQGPDVTIIDGNQTGSAVTCANGEDELTIIEGFTLYNGKSAEGGGMRIDHSSRPNVIGCSFIGNLATSYGGGLYIGDSSSPEVIDCNFIGNSILYSTNGTGGGMCMLFSSPIVKDCYFFGNSATQGGGGMAIGQSSNPQVTCCNFFGNTADEALAGPGGGGMGVFDQSTPAVEHCTFSGNTAKHGGGMYSNYSSPTVMDCPFSENTALEGGGGMYCKDFSNPKVTDCRFSNNAAFWGGGMANDTYSNPELLYCVFEGNAAPFGNGGGMYNLFYCNTRVISCTFVDNEANAHGGGMNNDEYCEPMVINCVFCGNRAAQGYGGAMFNQTTCRPELANCTLYGNAAHQAGGGIANFSQSDLEVTNCILWNDTPDEVHNSGSSNYITYSCIQGGHAGTGNIDLDPQFVDAAQGDVHLLFTSPCRNAGDTSSVKKFYDYEGDPRIAHGAVDMGGDEFYNHLYYTGNATPGGYVVGKIVGVPGTAPVGLFYSSDVLDPPMPTIWGNFHLQSPYFMLPLVPIPADGVLKLPGVIAKSPAAPYDLPMQALVGLDPDSLTNLCVLEVR